MRLKLNLVFNILRFDEERLQYLAAFFVFLNFTRIISVIYKQRFR